MKMFVTKRDGSLQPWDDKKVERALLGAFNEVQPGNIPDITDLTKYISHMVHENDSPISISSVHEFVTIALDDKGYEDSAEAYIDYKIKHDKLRDQRLTPDPQAIADYIHASKYAKYLPAETRREVYEETVERSQQMHLDKFVTGINDLSIGSDMQEAFDAVRQKKILPSMRSMQFGGKAIERNNARIYNCSFTLVNRIRIFAEIFHSLLSGCGVGYSVQWQHVEMIPEVKSIDKSNVLHYTIPDTIEGWADGLNILMTQYFVQGRYVEFNYSEIRKEGSSLSTGGKAPGHIALKKCLDLVRDKLDSATGRQLRPIEFHDIICFIADAVLAGGIRRSSLISLFSEDDSEMMYCKAHENFRAAWKEDPGHNSQRQMANNSAVLLRKTATKEKFKRIIDISRQWGDPAFYFTDDLNFGCNPCGEIGLDPMLAGDWSGIDKSWNFNPNMYENSPDLAEPSSANEAIKYYGHNTGFQFCNLCEVNVAVMKTPEEFYEAVRKAAFIGTLQASYADFKYLGPVTENIVKSEYLLGIGLTGIMDNPSIGLNPQILQHAASQAIKENARVAKLIGIGPAARVTTVKPSGTASLELGCIGSGIHYHHARRYFRRVTANPNEPIAIEFKRVNPHMVEVKPNGDWSIVFPVTAPDDAKVVKEESGLDFMDHVFTVFENWVKPGSLTVNNLKKLTHNVSCTIAVHEGEWDKVIEKAWQNRHRITAMSFLAVLNDKAFPYAPREEVTTQADESKWNCLIENYTPIDYTKLVEKEDATKFTQDPACVGGVCEI